MRGELLGGTRPRQRDRLGIGAGLAERGRVAGSPKRTPPHATVYRAPSRSARVAWAAGFRRIEPADPTVPARDGDASRLACRAHGAPRSARLRELDRHPGGTRRRPSPVVLFDLDDTLMAHREAVVAGILRHMRERAYDGDEHAAAGRWHELEEEHYTAYLKGALSFEGQRRARAAAFAREFGDELDERAASAWFAEYFRHYRDSWALHDDVLPAFDALGHRPAPSAVRHRDERRARVPDGQDRATRPARSRRARDRLGRGRHREARPRHLPRGARSVRAHGARVGGGLRRRSPAHRRHRRGAGRASSASGSTGTASAHPTTRRPRRSTPAWWRSTGSTSSPRGSCRASAERPRRGPRRNERNGPGAPPCARPVFPPYPR